MDKAAWVRADFNGLFGDLLCLSHQDTVTDWSERTVTLEAGMRVTAFEHDEDNAGNRYDLIASGIVEPSPMELSCLGSRWCLRIDADGVRHESDCR